MLGEEPHEGRLLRGSLKQKGCDGLPRAGERWSVRAREEGNRCECRRVCGSLNSG